MSLSLIALTLLAQSAPIEAKAEIIYEENPPAVTAPPPSDAPLVPTEAPAQPVAPSGETLAEEPAPADDPAAMEETTYTEGEPPALETSGSSEAFPPVPDAAASMGAPPDASISTVIDPRKDARGRSLFRGAVELLAHSMPSGTPLGQQDLYANFLPLLSVDTGDNFGFELGGVLRLRVFDDPPSQRPNDYGGLLRREDWDEQSDFGQLLRELWLGSEESPVRLRAGPLHRVSMGRGLLVNRYSNQLNANYHPAGGVVTVEMGPIHAQALASDLLAARLFAVQVTGDIAEIIGAADQRGRFHGSISAGHDFGQAGGVTSPLTLLQMEGDAGLYQSESLRAFAYAALGSRLLTENFAMGAALGLSADGDVGGAVVGAKLEARKVGGGFRFGMFGPSYELSRFSDTGLNRGGAADVLLPDGFSGYAEVQVELGHAADLGLSRQGAVVVSAAAEYFSWGRVDLDGTFTGRLPGDVGTASARITIAGLNEAPRYQASAELRYRFAPSFYALGHGGMVFFPQPDSQLVRGVFAGVGVGADFSH